MKKYDVTGVGLNLGTAEEYTKKTVSVGGVVCAMALPAFLFLWF
jgi:hypothetical protein